MGTLKFHRTLLIMRILDTIDFFFLLSFPIPDSSVSEAVSIRVRGLFHPRYLENGPLEPGYFG